MWPMHTDDVVLRSLLEEQLLLARQRDEQARARSSAGQPVEVPVTGAMLSGVYEQLRNAAEYAEEHLLLQRAIKRFCKRNVFLLQREPAAVARELIVELVQAGYLQNGAIGAEALTLVAHSVQAHTRVYGALRQAHVGRDVATEWVLAFMSVEIESLLNPHNHQRALAFFAYSYFLDRIARDDFQSHADAAQYELCLYIAVHQALLKSDVDIVRFDLFGFHELSMDDAHAFRLYNQQIDHLFTSTLTATLRRIIGKHGAPFRVLNSLVEDRPDTAELLHHPDQFMDAFSSQISRVYANVQRRLNRGLIKSVIFLLITKAIIGVAVEIPYDIIVHGGIAFVPLAVNLLFPPLYMAGLKLGLRPPSMVNADALQQAIRHILYEPNGMHIMPPQPRRLRPFTRLLYVLIFCLPIVFTVWVLREIGFNVVQMAIFFIFFSTASSLGFRLSGMVREIELSSHRIGTLSALRDFFYLPFIMVGQWLSRKYSKLNIVARFLDLAIELPLKAVLRLFRQWTGFLSEKRDELY